MHFRSEENFSKIVDFSLSSNLVTNIFHCNVFSILAQLYESWKQKTKILFRNRISFHFAISPPLCTKVWSKKKLLCYLHEKKSFFIVKMIFFSWFHQKKSLPRKKKIVSFFVKMFFFGADSTLWSLICWVHVSVGDRGD